MKDINNPKYLTVLEMANLLKISRIAVFKKIKNGQIPAEKIGRNYAIPYEYVADVIPHINERFSIEENKGEIKRAVSRVVKEYGETLKLLGKE